MRPLWAGLACGAVVALNLGAQTQPTFYAAYEDGLEEARLGQWRRAVGAFHRAAALRPESAARVIIYGNNLLSDYYPYAQLARCYLELGELEAAAGMLRQAELRGEPASLREPLAHRLPKAGGKAAPAEGEAGAGAKAPKPAKAELEAPPVHPEPPAGLPATLPVPLTVPAVEPFRSQAALPGPLPLPQAGPSRITQPAAAAAQDPSLAQGPAVGPLAPAPKPEAIPPLPPALGWLGAGLVASGLLLAWRRRRPKPPIEVPAQGQDPAWPETIGPYRILQILGHGGFATTYLARHGATGQEVALKVLHPHRLRDPDFVKRFAREARLGALLNHPSLVRLLDPGPPEGTSWIALEYVPGPTLALRLQEGGPLPLEEAIEIALSIAKAMAYAHAHGVVHRDLKPANIILGPRGPKVMDLGIARELDTHAMTTTYAFMGTPLYAAPEAQLVTKAGPAADRYSLGVILFELLAGVPPYRGETPFAILDQHRSAPVPDLAGVREVPMALARLLRRLLDKDPEQRPEDGELVAKLERLRDHFDDAPTMPGA